MTTMRVRPEIVFLMAILLSLSSCSRLPSEGDAKAYWRSQVDHSKGLIRLVSFAKTDGKSTPNGYTLYYAIRYEFTDNCQYDANFHSEKGLPQGLNFFASIGSGRLIGKKGQQKLQTGEMWYERRESGWHLVTVANTKVAEFLASNGARTAAAEPETKKESNAGFELNSGKELHKTGHVKEAISRYEKAIASDPTLSEAEFFLGLAWSDLGDLDQAIKHYERCLSLDPKNGKCEANLAGLLVSKGLRREARQRYEHCLSLDPNLDIAHKGLADLLSGEGEYDKAIAHYEEAIRIHPDFKEAKQNLALVRKLAGH